MARRRPPHEFTHTPVGRFQWEQLVRRAELDPSTKYVALMFATWASADGGDLTVGERLLADGLGRKERMVREHLAALRELGLIEMLLEAAPGRAGEYQLTFPGTDYPLIPLRLDVDGSRLIERPDGRMGERRPPKDTGTRVPMSDSDDRHPGAYDGEFTGTRAHEDRHPGAATPAPGRTMTGTRVPPTNTRPDHDHPSPRVPGSDSPPTSTQVGPEQANTNQPSHPTQRTPDDPDAAYRAARRIVDHAPKADRDAALAQAAGELRDHGIVGVRSTVVRAAELLIRWNARDPITAQEGP